MPSRHRQLGARTPYDHAWRKLRAYVLRRDHHICYAVGCALKATTVDHIVALDQGGPRLDPNNCRASCVFHNATGGAAITNAKRRAANLGASKVW